MPWLHAFVRNVLGRRHIEQDLDEEVDAHLELLVEQHRADGAREMEARRAARLDMGGVDQVKDAVRDARRGLWLDQMWRDLRFGARTLRRSPGFTIVAVLSLALGIGAASTLFSVTYGVLLKPLPWLGADRLVRVTETRKGHEPRVRGTMSNGPYHAWTANHSSIDAIGGWRLNQTASTLTIAGGDASRVQTTAVTPSLFAVLKVRPFIGRLFVDDDAVKDAGPGTARFILLSYGLWQERFGGRDEAIGGVIRLDGKSVTVVGVMAREFAFPDRDTRAWTPWVPPAVAVDDGPVRTMSIFSAIARLRPGATPEQATAEGTARARTAPDPGLTAVALFGGSGLAELRAIPAVDLMTAEVRQALLMLLAAVALLLAAATANIATLQLARSTARRRELAIRAAIGAGSAALTRQLVAESAMLGAGGALAGVALTIALHHALPSVLPADFPRIDAVAVDWRVLLFAILASIATSVACGLLPAWHARRVDLVGLLAEDGNAPIGGSLNVGTTRTRALLMAGQISVSCVLLVGAVLVVRSFTALLRVDRGYDATNVFTALVAFPSEYSMERRTTLLEHVAERLRALPGVRAAAYGNALPLLTSGGFRAFKMRPPVDPSIEMDVNVIERVVSPEYIDALGLRLIAGRRLSVTDTATSFNAIAVNRSFAAKYLGAKAIGSVVPNLGMCRGDSDRWEVVGVLDDMLQSTVSDQAQPEVFIPVKQVGCTGALAQAVIVLRATEDPARYATSVRNAVREQDPSLAVDSMMLMEDRIVKALAKPRLYAVVLTGFACSALAIAAVGIFGIVSYTVAQRSREIGLRTALGATSLIVVRLVLRQIAVITAGGISVGLLAAFALSRLLTTVLYGVKPHDISSFAAVALVLICVATLACVVPARRATKIDPLQVMR